MLPIQYRLKIGSAPTRLALKQFGCELRVAMPAIVVPNPNGDPFDENAQTVSVQPAVMEVIREDAVPTITQLPILDDVPFSIPRAGGWSLTMPIAVGDECLLVFSDMAFDHWWESGGVQKQPDGILYRHDIGDAMAIFGVTSKPRALANYSTSSAQLRSDDGTVVIDLTAGQITITAPAVNIAAGGGTGLPLLNANLLQWMQTNLYPYLTSHGYTGPVIPTNSETTVLTGE